MESLSILGIVGSLRRASYNRGLMRAAQELLPEGLTLNVADIGGLPLFNEDLEANVPAEVQTFKRQIKESDAVLIATPEYNYSVPGVLKNALDWGSRPYGDNSFDGKPAGLMGASVGMLGTARAQYHLRQTFVFLNVHPLNQPEIMVPFAQQNFDADGNLTNEKTRAKISQMLQALADWTRLLKKSA